jgi:predicted ATP-grasp superfamily ATP-dependent carboligase
LIPFSEKLIHRAIIRKGKFSELISKDIYEDEIFSKLKDLINSNGAIYLFPYQCFSSDFDFFEKLGFKILASKNISTVSILSNKVHFYEFLKRLNFDLIEGEIAKDFDEALEIFNKLKDVYVAKERGAGGSGTFHITSEQDLKIIFKNYEERVLVEKWLDNIVASPNVLAVTPSGDVEPDDVAVISVSDQIIENTKYCGNIFPSRVDKEVFDKLVSITKIIGSELGKLGYAGIFGLDLLVVREKRK